MRTGRIEAFSDGVLAIVITISVLEMHPPHSAELGALRDVAPVFFSYLLSFVYLGIYWNNHHHLLHAARHGSGGVMWANLHLLFWLSLVPFATGWMGENRFAAAPTAAYGAVLLMAAIAYRILEATIVANEGPDSLLARAVGSGFKEKISPLLYVAAIPGAFVSPWISATLYVAVAVLWLVPDPRIERAIREEAGS